MRKQFYIQPKDLNFLTRRLTGNMYALEKSAKNFFGDHVAWKKIDTLMSWAAKDKEWYKMDLVKFKEVFHSHAIPIHRIPKNASVKVGMQQVETAYFAYYLSHERFDRKEEMKNYITRSLKTA